MNISETGGIGSKANEVLSRITSDLAGHSDMPRLLEQVVNTSMETLGAEVCSIFLIEREGDKEVVVMRAGSGFAKRVVGKAIYELGEGLTGHVVQHMKGYTFGSREELENLTENGKVIWEGKHDKRQWESGQSEFRNGIVLPLIIRGRCLGVIKVENKLPKGEQFSEHDVIYFKTIANVVALAIENAKSHQRTSDVLSSITGALEGQLDMQLLLDQVVTTSMETLWAEVCSIFLVEREGDRESVVMRAGSGFAKRVVNKAKYELGEGLTGHVVQNMKGYNFGSRDELENLKENGKLIWEGKHDKRQWESGQSEFRNGIVLPLIIRGRCLGVIKVENKHPAAGERFCELDQLYLTTIANVVALAIENAKLHERTEVQLKAIAGKAAHRICNQTTDYDGIEKYLEAEIIGGVPNLNQLGVILDRLRASTRNLKRTTDEFKNYGKPIHLNPTRRDVNRIIEDEVRLVETNHKVPIQMSLDHNLPMLLVDAPRFAEAIKELLLNSVTAIKKKSAQDEEGNIQVTSQFVQHTEPYSVHVTITDNGPGFQPNFPLFEPFYSTNPDSMGLGLATVKELIEAHKGSIQTQAVNNGASIRIEIPFS